MAGMAAALFAAQRGIDTVQVGITGEMGFASGLLDLLGVHPVADGRIVEDPWQGITQLCRDEPLHPYAEMELASIHKAMDDLLAFVQAGGYPHVTQGQRNMEMMTPVGTSKPTYAVPYTMQHGPTALAQRAPCLLVGFEGLKGFSVRQIALSLDLRWPRFASGAHRFPGCPGRALYRAPGPCPGRGRHARKARGRHPAPPGCGPIRGFTRGARLLSHGARNGGSATRLGAAGP
ncbi:MAG: FAD-binding protein [Desulfobacterales bacterium]|nr:FAD-binding protein [Desulfobacterales bacterium]